MIISQTTTIIFQYPKDYLQEQEWLKGKEEQWVHIGTDTQCAIYEYQISYAIGEQQIAKDSQEIVKDLVKEGEQ